MATNYVIKPGDTLTKIAANNNTTVAAIAKANNIANPNMIKAGAALNIGTAPKPVVAPVKAPVVAPVKTTAPVVNNPFSGLMTDAQFVAAQKEAAAVDAANATRLNSPVIPQTGPQVGPNLNQNTNALGARNDYINNFMGGVQDRNSWMTDAEALAKNRSMLEYDDQIARIKKIAAEARMNLGDRLNRMTPEYDDLRTQANQAGYERQKAIEQMLARSGMLNTGAHVGNQQLVDRDTTGQINKVNLQQQLEEDTINSQAGLIDNNENLDLSELDRLKGVFISGALQQADQEYKRYKENRLDKANELYNVDRDFAFKQDESGRDQFNVDRNYGLDQSKLKLDQDTLAHNKYVDLEKLKDTDLDRAQNQTQFDKKYSLDLKDFNEKVRMNNAEISLRKSEIAQRFAASRSSFNSALTANQAGKLSQDSLDALSKENGRVDQMISAAIASGHNNLISYYINSSTLPANVKSAKLKQIGSSMSISPKDMGVDIREYLKDI